MTDHGRVRDSSRRASAALRRWSLRVPLSEYAAVAAALALAAVAITWPHARFGATHVVSHFDSLFSMWRLGWFAHAQRLQLPLWDANIFYPARTSLLYSDATLLQGVLAMPLLWAGATVPLVYNALLLLGVVTSGLAMYWLVRTLGVGRAPAMIGALIFSLAPYRIEHANHLELQWSGGAVAAFGLLYRVLVTPRWRDGLLLAVAVWLQFLSAVYYVVFAVPLLGVMALAALPFAPNPRKSAPILALSAVLCGALTVPVARQYLAVSGRTGARPIGEVKTYSARPINYLASPRENMLYGWTADRLGSGERRLFPGAAAIALAIAGLFSRRRSVAVLAAALLLLAFELSLGMHGRLYPLLHQWWPALHGLRAPARYGMFTLAAVAALASLGGEQLLQLIDRASSRMRAAALATCIAAALCIEYRSPLTDLYRVDVDAPVYTVLRGLPRGVVLELPLGDIIDADYIFFSTRHWFPLVNGYSGYYPASYRSVRAMMEAVPHPASIAFMKQLNVRYVLIHVYFLEPQSASHIATAFLRDSAFRPLGTYRDWVGEVQLFELTPVRK